MEACAFCGLKLSQVVNLIKSPIDDDICICDKCAERSYSIINGDINKKSAGNLRKNRENPRNMEILQSKNKQDNIDFDMTPSEIHKELDKYVIGQNQAKKILSVAIYNHNKRLHDKNRLIKKSNILLAGPSGTGKTLLAHTLANIINVPFVIADATSLTETGYVGNDVNTILQQLLDAADGNLKYAQKGIVYIDEIDKLAREGKGRSISRDVSGEGVQQALLKLIEGCQVSVPVGGRRNHPQDTDIIFDTSNVLFICGGAFENLFDSPLQNTPIGFITTNDNFNKEIPIHPYEALVKFGFMPEFIGRFPIFCSLDSLKLNDLVRILSEPEDAIIKEYQLLFKQDGIKLEYEDNALQEIARLALEKGTGARGLRNIIEDVMLDTMYNIPDCKDTVSKCTITKESIRTKKPAITKKRRQKKKAAATAS